MLSNRGDTMDYFECDVPPVDGRCSDDNCPCSEVVIARGKGYLFIDQGLVDFRRDYPTLEDAREAIQRKQQQVEGSLHGAFISSYRLGPILVCEQGARLRNLDLDTATKDARHWWQTGKVPLRPTPISVTELGATGQSERSMLAKVKVLAAVAMADGTIDSRERARLEKFCENLGLKRQELHELLSQPMAIDRKDLPRSDKEKRELLIEVLRMAAADGQIDDTERQAAGKIAKSLGLGREDIKACLEEAKRRDRYTGSKQTAARPAPTSHRRGMGGRTRHECSGENRGQVLAGE
ncbi:MAG: TerB family tellurite resistance protein [Planctomycetes bacterium]|nr:TerB family tellurite resistance protein [Planctomycetota bacterium]